MAGKGNPKGTNNGGGRKPRPNAKRHNVLIDNEVWDYLNETGASAEIERLTRKEMNTTCPNCGCTAYEKVTTGHCNNHGEANWQETTNTYYCRECGTVIKQETFTTPEKPEQA